MDSTATMARTQLVIVTSVLLLACGDDSATDAGMDVSGSDVSEDTRVDVSMDTSAEDVVMPTCDSPPCVAWPRLLAGPSAEDEIDALASDPAGNVWVSGKFDVDGTLGATADVIIRDDAKSVALGGTDAGSVVTSGGFVGSAAVGGVHGGVLAARMGMGTAKLATVTGGVVAAGLNTKSLSVSGASTDGLFTFGTSIGPDRIYNTADDVITGGTLHSAVFAGSYIDSATTAGVLPNMFAASSNVQNRPDDNRAFTGDPGLFFDVTRADSAEAGGVLPSMVERFSIRGLVVNTSSPTGRQTVLAAADGIGGVSGGPALAALTQREFLDPPGAPTVQSTLTVNDARIDIFFSEPMNSGSFVLGVDANDDGDLDDPADTPGSVIVTSGAQILDDVFLQYLTTIGDDGEELGVLQIFRAGGFDGVVNVELRGPIVDQAGFLDDPTIFDSSGLRSALRDFDQDGTADTDEDRLGTILDGDVDLLEGGNADLFFPFGDVADSFIESLVQEGPLSVVVDTPGLLVAEQLDNETDIDVFRFTADAFQYLSVEYDGNALVQLAVFIHDDQGTPDDVLDDRFEMLTRHETNNFFLDPDADLDLFMAVELPPIEDAIDPSGFRETDLQYFVAVVPASPAIVNEPYSLTLNLTSEDRLLPLPADEQIAYISNVQNDGTNPVGSRNNFDGAQVPKQLVFLDFDGGVSTQVDPGGLVEPFDAAIVNPLMDDLEDVLINGNSNVTGIVDTIIRGFETTPGSYPGGGIDIERFDTGDLIALAGDVTNLPDGVVITTEDPSLFGLDPDTDYTTVLIGQLDFIPGVFGAASTVDYANLSKADEIIVFAQEFTGLNETLIFNQNIVLNTFAESFGGTIFHELGHVFGLNHTGRNTVIDDPNNDGDPTDSVDADLQNIIAAGPSSVFPDDFLELPIIGTAVVEVSEFIKIGGDPTDPEDSEAYIDTLANLFFWLM